MKEEAKSLGGLRTSVDARDTSVLHAIKELESQKLVHRDTVTHSYSLTSIGYMYTVMLDQLLGASDVLRETEDFWLHHDVSGIPEHLLMGIHTLRNATVVRAVPSDLNAIHRRYLETLRNSRRIHGVSPVFHADFAEIVAEILGKDAEVRLVVTKEVLDRIREAVKLRNLAKYVKGIIVNRNLEIRLREGLKVGLTATDKFLSLGLFTLDGTYDYGVDVMSSDPQALEWGERLFEYYRGFSDRISFSSIF